jgi:diguanylate cyclase (GGDEF)-like protein/PAS domain S-box-containing protein
MTAVDIRIIFIIHVFLILLCAVVMAFLWWQNRKRSPEIGFWFADYILQFAAIFFITLRGILPDLISIILAHLNIIAGTIILYIGLGRYVGRESRQWHNYVMLIVFILVHAYLTYVYPDIELRTVNSSLALIFICSQCAWLMLRGVAPELRPASRMAGIVFSLFCLVGVVQIAVNLSKPRTNDLLVTGFANLFAIITFQILFVALTFSLFLLVSRRLSMELERELLKREQEEKITQVRLSLLEFSTTHSLDELLQKTLDEVGALVESPIGFYHFVEEDQNTLSLQAWSTRTLNEFCKAEGRGRHYGIDQAGVWVDCVYQKRVVIHNDYSSLPHRKGLPEGHAAVIRELVVPIMRGGKVVAILGVGNKSENYTQKDSEIVSYLADVAWEITRRKLAEEALRRSEEKYKQLAEVFPETIFEADMKGDVIYANPYGLKQFGFTEEDLAKGVNIFDLISPHDHKLVQERIESRILNNDKRYLEYQALKKDGSSFDALALSVPIMIEGMLVGIRGFIMDITERKRAEEAIKSSEEQVRLLLNSTAEAIYGVDLQGNVTFVNKSFLNMMGYDSLEQLRGKNMHRIIHHSYPDGTPMPAEDCRVYRAFRTGKGEHVDNEVFWKKDGTSFPVEYWSYPQIVDGKVYGAVNTFIDITERKKSEEQIKHLATHDLLTDLPSLRLARDRMSTAMNMARRYKKAVALMFIDLDGFKIVNDTLGHDAGDYVLKQVAKRLLSCVRETDTVARVGGDEFLIIATEINSPDNAAQIAEKVVQTVSQPININGQLAVVGTSIGIALFPEHSEDTNKLIKLADEAMYKVKNSGKNNFRFVNV